MYRFPLYSKGLCPLQFPLGPRPCLHHGYNNKIPEQGMGTDDHLLPLGDCSFLLLFPLLFISSLLHFFFPFSSFLPPFVTLSVPLLMVASIVCLTYPISIVLTPVFLSLHFLFPSFLSKVPFSSIQICVSSLCRSANRLVGRSSD